MKRILSVLLCAAVLAGCSSSTAASASKTASASATDDPSAKCEGVMTYAEYEATEADGTQKVTIEAYVQAKQGWWEDEGQGKASIYLQDPDGAYFVYELPIDEADYNKLVEGQKVEITGYKSAWSGENEIVFEDADGAYKIEDGNWIAEATDVTSLLAKEDDLIKYQNQKVSFKGLKVVAQGDSDAAFLYNYDGSGSQGDDLYFNVTDDTNTYTFTVESYLCDKDSDVYKAVEALKIGDTVDMEGFLYWYNGVNPHITKVTVK